MEEVIRPYKNLYFNSPEWVRKTIGATIRFLPKGVRYGKTYRELAGLLNQSQFWSPEQIEAYQSNKIMEILSHALRTVPFYMNLKNHPHIPELKNGMEWIKEFPLVTREMIRENEELFCSQEISKNRFIEITTGGSTGVPMHFFHDRGLTNPAERAFQWRQREWAGFHYGDPVVIIRGRGLGGREWRTFEPADNALVISGYHLEDTYFPGIVDSIIKFNPVAIQAYPSNAMLIAAYWEKHNLPPLKKLKVLLCGSENLFDFQRNYLENVFNCRVYSWYGQTEYVVLAGGCECNNQYHIYPEYGYTELIRADGSVIEGPGEMGEIVGTSFYNFAMPFIRYRTGDYAEYDDKVCECGRPYRLFKTLYGREQNFVVTNDHRVVSLTGLIFGQHFKAFTRIKKFQLEQTVPGEVKIRMIQDFSFKSEDIEEIEREILKCVGGGLKSRFEYVNAIPATKAGKHLFLIQNLDIQSYLKN